MADSYIDPFLPSTHGVSNQQQPSHCSAPWGCPAGNPVFCLQGTCRLVDFRLIQCDTSSQVTHIATCSLDLQFCFLWLYFVHVPKRDMILLPPLLSPNPTTLNSIFRSKLEGGKRGVCGLHVHFHVFKMTIQIHILRAIHSKLYYLLICMSCIVSLCTLQYELSEKRHLLKNFLMIVPYLYNQTQKMGWPAHVNVGIRVKLYF